jgi:hypothetical protein
VNDFKKLVKDLQKLEKMPVKEIKEKVLLREGDLLADQLKAAAPANFIRQDIMAIDKGSRYPSSIMVGIDYSSGARANLAYAFEYGSVDRYTKAGYFRGALKPSPFFRPVIDSNRKQIVTNIINGIGKIVEKKLK